MINIDLLNTIDFDINVNEKFSYLYYNQNETVEEDTKIVNRIDKRCLVLTKVRNPRQTLNFVWSKVR